MEKEFKKLYKDDPYNPDIKDFIHQSITHGYKEFSPHISGFYYIQMVQGQWFDDYKTLGNYDGTEDSKEVFGEFSKYSKKLHTQIKKKFGQMATDIDIPQLNLEYESISGKQRTLNYASRLHYASDLVLII